MIEIRSLSKGTWQAYSARLQEFESKAEYPLGSDAFKISHGDSYFSFFERLGEPVFHVALDGERVIACAAAVLREIPFGAKKIRAWYVCDLKVDPDYRRQGIPTRLFLKGLFWNYLRCPRAYGISMDPLNAPNRVLALSSKLPFLPFGLAGKLNIYSLSFEEYKFLEKSLAELLGPLGFLSLSGKKDIVLKSTGKPMDLLHLQHGPKGEQPGIEARPGAVHMLCAPSDSRLDLLLGKHFKEPARASIIAHGMKKVDWGFVLTSEI